MIATNLRAPIAFNPENFRAFIRRRGEPFTWYQAQRCSCYNPESSARVQMCSACEQGFIYFPQTVAAGVVVVFGETTRSMVAQEVGLIPVGMTTITCMPDEVPLSFADKIVRTATVTTHKQVYKRGAGGSDALAQTPAAQILRVTQNSTIYTPVTDYTLSGNNIVWHGIHKPAADSNYSVAHTYHPTYWFLDEFRQEAPPSQFANADGSRVMLPLYGALSRKHASLWGT